MLLYVLGYDATAEGLTGSDWAINVAKLCVQRELDEDIVDYSGAKTMTREEAAKMVFNTMLRTTVTYNGTNQAIQIGDITITNKGEAVVGTTLGSLLFKANYSKLHLETTDITAVSNGKATLANATTDDFGRAAKTWYYGSVQSTANTIGTYAAKADHTFVVNSVSGTKATLSTWLKDINKNYTIPTIQGASSVVYVNGTQYTTNSDYTPKVGDVVDVFQNSTTATTIDRIVITNYKLAKITKVDTNVSTADKNATPAVSAYVTLKDEK